MSVDTRYKILEKIGSGSFATVYRAKDEELGREVAIKQLHSEYLADPARLDRYWQEAQLLASLQHPNIVTIFDIVRERGWLVMELMQSNLATRLAGRQVDLRALRASLAHVLRALKYLHSHGIIHGDIKPSNLMIDVRRRIKLGDFGLARRVNNAEGSLLKGTTKYMAPETVSDDFGDVGPQSDLYSLGFTAYDLMCGPNFDDLFPGLNAKGRNQQIAWMMWHAAPDRHLPEIDRVLEGVPPDVAKVVQKLTQKDPALRYKSADEALSDLQIDLKLIGTQGGEAPEAAPPDDGKRRRLIAIGALACSVLMSAAFLLFSGGNNGKVEVKKSRGLIREVVIDKHEFVVQDLNTGALESFKVPRKQKIFLLNDKKNILLRELLPGDHVEMDIDKKQLDLAVNVLVDRPVPTRGTLKELNLPDSRVILSMEEGNTRDELPVRVPAAAKLKLNGVDVKLLALQVGDRLEITHLSEPGEAKGRVLNSLMARRTLTTVGFVTNKFDADQSKLAIQIGQGPSASSLNLTVAPHCKVKLNGVDQQDGQPITAASLKSGDRVSLTHDTEVVEIAATRSLQFEGTVQAISNTADRLTILLANGQRKDLAVDGQCEITLALERVNLLELRQFDNVRVTYSEAADDALTAVTVDAGRPAQTDRWTVVLGTQGYADSTLSPLKTTLNDARLVHGMLLSRYAVSDRPGAQQRGALLVDATKKDWERQLVKWLTSAQPQTQVLIYITGHAYLGEDDKVYLAAKDFDFANMPATGVPLDWLAEKLNECSSKNKLLVLDVTPAVMGQDSQRQLAGKALLDKLKTPFQSTSVVVSCDAGQQSRVWTEKQHGLFAWWLSEALQGAADTDRDLHLTPDELFGFLKRQSETAPAKVFADQTPVMVVPNP